MILEVHIVIFFYFFSRCYHFYLYMYDVLNSAVLKAYGQIHNSEFMVFMHKGNQGESWVSHRGRIGNVENFQVLTQL